MCPGNKPSTHVLVVLVFLVPCWIAPDLCAQSDSQSQRYPIDEHGVWSTVRSQAHGLAGAAQSAPGTKRTNAVSRDQHAQIRSDRPIQLTAQQQPGIPGPGFFSPRRRPDRVEDASEPPVPGEEYQRRALPLPPQQQEQQQETQPQYDNPASHYILRQTTTQQELNLQPGVPQILTLRQPHVRTYIPASGENIVAIRYIDPDDPRRVAIEPLDVGTTTLTLWFRDESSPDGEIPVSWLVRVTDPDAPESEEEEAIAQNRSLELQLQALEREINYSFPNSSVQLSWVGSQVLMRGKAKDVEEATQIARIVSSSLPGGQGNAETDFLQNAEFLTLDPQAILEAGSLPGALRGDNATGINQGRINNRVINLLEIAGVHQVQLKVTVAEVNRSAARAIGANLEIGSVGNVAQFLTTLATPTVGGALVLDRGDFDLTIAAMKQLNLARSLAEPTLTTLNGQPANFNVGGSFPIPVLGGQTADALQGVEFQNFGVQLQFLPVVTNGDRIRLTLQASVSTVDESALAQVGGTDVPGLNTRNFSNTVELREGQTLAVAGLIQTNLAGTSSRIPFAGDVPGLGRLFSSDSTSYDEQELVVLVTPHLVGPIDAEQQPLALPGSDYFEPDDFEFFLSGRLEGHIAEDYRSPVRTSLEKMKAFRRCEQQLIIGQPGHSNGLMCPPAHRPSTLTQTDAVPADREPQPQPAQIIEPHPFPLPLPVPPQASLGFRKPGIVSRTAFSAGGDLP